MIGKQIENRLKQILSKYTTDFSEVKQTTLSSQNNIVIGTAVANRHYTQIEDLIGFFVNSLALRVEIDNKLLIY